MKNEVRVLAIGDVARLPESVRRELERVIEMTQHNSRLTVGLCVSYGGREDIVEATRAPCARRPRRRSTPRRSISRHSPTRSERRAFPIRIC